MNSLAGIIAANRAADKAAIARELEAKKALKPSLRKPVKRIAQPKRDPSGRLSHS